MERDAALVAEAVRRVGEWHGVLFGQVGVVEGRIFEAGGLFADHVGQLTRDLATGFAPDAAEAAMDLEARAVAVEARVAADRREVDAVRSGLRGREAVVEFRQARAEFVAERAAELEAQAAVLEVRAEERAARIDVRAHNYAEGEMRSAWTAREEARAVVAAAEGAVQAQAEAQARAAEGAVGLVAQNDWL